MFVFAAARFLSIEELGEYGLFAASVAYCSLLIGMDFYIFSTRELVGNTSANQGQIVIDSFKFILMSFVCFSIPLIGVFEFSLLKWEWVLYFYALLFFEVLSQEMSRIIIAVGRPVAASLLLFIRTSLWALMALLLFVLVPGSRSLAFVLGMWLGASFLSVLMGMFFLTFVQWKCFFSVSFSTQWCLRGIKVGIVFLFATLALRSVFVFDRYAIDYWGSSSMLGVYVVYVGLCGAIWSFFDAAVFQFDYPRLIALVKSEDRSGFSHRMAGIVFKVIGLLLLVFAAFFIFIDWILIVLEKDEFLANLEVFWMLFIAHSLFVLSYIPHYGLYALKKDRWIVLGNTGTCLVFFMGLFWSDAAEGVERVVYSMCVAFVFVLVFKSTGFIRSYRIFMNQEGEKIYAQ